MTQDARKAELTIVSSALVMGLSGAGIAALATGAPVTAGLIFAGAFVTMHLTFGAAHAAKIAPERTVLVLSVIGAGLAATCALLPSKIARVGIDIGVAFSLAGMLSLVFSLVAGRAFMLDFDASDGS